MNNSEKAEKIQKIISKINWEISEMQILFNKTFMSHKMFRLMLSENNDIRRRFDQLEERKFRLKRILWQ